MKNNLWLYADKGSQTYAAGSLIVFGAENFKRAKIVADFHKLKLCNDAMQQGIEYDRIGLAHEFFWEYLIDCVKILIFFEGYMKAELIVQNFCVHSINTDGTYPHLKSLARQQRSRPITLDEIQALESFIVDKQTETITNGGLKETTIGLNTLLTPKYRAHYQFDSFITDALLHFNETRNQLHFNTTVEFQLSGLLIERIRQLNEFVDRTIARWIVKK